MYEVALCPRIAAVAAGGEHSLLLDSSGCVYSCGNSENGRLGFLVPLPSSEGTLGPAQHGQDVTLPTEIPCPPCLRIFAGEYHSAFVTASEPHALWTFGCGSVGQLGHGSSTDDVLEPKCVESLASQFASQGTAVADAALGDGHTLVLATSGSCHAFGNNESGALGVLGSTLSGFSKQSERYGFGVRGPSRITPSPVVALASLSIIKIATGTRHTLFVADPSGDVYGAGDNQFGQLALPGLARSTVPRKVPLHDGFPASVKVVRVACGARHSLFLGSDGLVRGCGSNESGELGLGADCQGTSAITLLPLLSEIVDVVAGAAHSLFLTRSGDVYGCGWGACGALGTGTSANVTTPARVLEAATLGSPVVQVSCSSHHSLALTADGTVRTAGCNGHGQLGSGMIVSKQLSWMAITAVARINEQQREVAVAASVQRQRALSSDAVSSEGPPFQPRYTGGGDPSSAAVVIADVGSDDEAATSLRSAGSQTTLTNGATNNNNIGGSPSFHCFERVCPTPQY